MKLVPSFDSEQLWVGMFAPARTPAVLVGKLNRELSRFCNLRYSRRGRSLLPGTPEEFSAYIKRTMVKMKKLIEIAAIRTE